MHDSQDYQILRKYVDLAGHITNKIGINYVMLIQEKVRKQLDKKKDVQKKKRQKDMAKRQTAKIVRNI